MENTPKEIRLPIYIAIALCVGVLIGSSLFGFRKGNDKRIAKGVAKFEQVLNKLDKDYVDTVNIDKLVETGISKMLQVLDPHSSYISAEDLSVIQSKLEGNYEGIGIEFNVFNDTIRVISPISGGPSEKLGVQSGDKIVKVGRKTVAGVGISNKDVVDMLRGEGGSTVKVSIKRRGENNLIDFEIERDVIPQYSIDTYYMADKEVGYIKIARFANSTYLEFKDALIKLEEQGMTKLIIDLTGNSGGYLQRAVEIVDELIGGEQMIVYTDGKEKRHSEKYFSGKKGDFEEGKLVVMIDEGSASASEIVAGAIQDHDRGIIVGRRSFGKGLVQLPFGLKDDSQLRLTISRYYTPSGRSIQKYYDKEDLKSYYKEAYDRHKTGELYSPDNIKVNDSLAFRTDKGRLVYGGGGITPDYFVPLDTTNNSTYFNRLFSTNSLREFTANYSEDNRKKFEDMGLDNFKKSFQVSDYMLKQLIQTANENGLKYDRVGFDKSKEMIKLLVKAYIARGIWHNEGFYPIYNQNDEIFLKALDVIKQS